MYPRRDFLVSLENQLFESQAVCRCRGKPKYLFDILLAGNEKTGGSKVVSSLIRTRNGSIARATRTARESSVVVTSDQNTKTLPTHSDHITNMHLNTQFCIPIRTKYSVSFQNIDNSKLIKHKMITNKFMAPPWGLSTPWAPKELFEKFKKVSWSRNECLFLTICTIFCMREAVYISNDLRMRAGPLGP